MRPDSINLLFRLFAPKVRQMVWQWAEKNVDFSLCPSYETPLRGPYNPDFMPYWKEPVECLGDPNISEVWIIKCSRAGGSENLLLNPIRYAVACEPQPTLYISGDQKSVERFMEKRIKDGLRCSRITAEKLVSARALEHEIYFDAMDLIVTWPKNKMAFKQSGYKLILGDEVSTWPEYSADMLRKRTDTYSFSHIFGVSSPDPQSARASQDDPIFTEFSQTDKRYWFMPDLKTGRLFRFEMGSRATIYGLKWDQSAKRDDGSWNLEQVKKSAYYATPDGTRIDNADRLAIVAKGKWIATAPGTPGRHGYHINSFYMPWKSGDFGNIAAAFLDAKAKGKEQLRVFIYEYLAEPWMENVDSTEDEILIKRCAEYHKGMRITESEKYKDIYVKKETAIFVSLDVQKDCLWTVAREWVAGGDSGLIEFKRLNDFPDIIPFCEKLPIDSVWIDYGYEQRRGEVFQFCLNYGGYPTKGFGRGFSRAGPFLARAIDPFEGKTGGGKTQIKVYHFDTDYFKSHLLNLIRGETVEKWFVYNHIEHQYVRQVNSEQRVDGEWRFKKGHNENHLWDCETIQLLAATVKGLWRKNW